jgi:hypothetical protein
MRTRGFTFSLVSWMVCFAVLMGALAPSITHVLQRAGGSPDAPIRRWRSSRPLHCFRA